MTRVPFVTSVSQRGIPQGIRCVVGLIVATGVSCTPVTARGTRRNLRGTGCSEPFCVVMCSVAWPWRSALNPFRRRCMRFPVTPSGNRMTLTSSRWRWPARPRCSSHATVRFRRTSRTTGCFATWVDALAAAYLTCVLGCRGTRLGLRTGGSSWRDGSAPFRIDARSTTCPRDGWWRTSEGRVWRETAARSPSPRARFPPAPDSA